MWFDLAPVLRNEPKPHPYPSGVASLTAPRRAYQIPQRCRPTYGWSGDTDGRSVQVAMGASRKRMRRGEVVMTLSHGPWLVLLSRRVAVHGNHVGRSFARNLNRAERVRRSLARRWVPRPASGLCRSSASRPLDLVRRSTTPSVLKTGVFPHLRDRHARIPNRSASQKRALADQPAGAAGPA